MNFFLLQFKYHHLQSCQNQATDQTLPKATIGSDTGQSGTSYPSEERLLRRHHSNHDLLQNMMFEFVFFLSKDQYKTIFAKLMGNLQAQWQGMLQKEQQQQQWQRIGRLLKKRKGCNNSTKKKIKGR
jgi:hypothetical protein